MMPPASLTARTPDGPVWAGTAQDDRKAFAGVFGSRAQKTIDRGAFSPRFLEFRGRGMT
jgi:hypothetical protein